MELCIVAIFKNEGHALKEWIDHYLREGVDRFFLVDNGSTDGYDLKGYEEKVEVWMNPKKHSQVELTNHYLQKAKKYDWVLVVDLDEFMYSRKGFRTIKQYLKTIPPTIKEILVPWKQFGSSGFKKQPTSIIGSFIHRYNTDKFDTMTQTKSIIRGDFLEKMSIHSHSKTDYYLPNKSGIKLTCLNIDEKKLASLPLHLNHYRIQSWEFYSNIKMKRGDNAFTKNKRNRKTFELQDYNDIVDTELKRKWLKKGTHRVRSNRLKTVRRRRIH